MHFSCIFTISRLCLYSGTMIYLDAIMYSKANVAKICVEVNKVIVKKFSYYHLVSSIGWKEIFYTISFQPMLLTK